MQSEALVDHWPQIVFSTDARGAEFLESALFASGALSVMYQDEFDQPILEPAPGEFRLWNSIRLVGLYALEQRPEDILTDLSLAYAASSQKSLPAHEWIPLPDRQWERAWMDDFKPMQFGPGLWICPTHCDPIDPDAVNVTLDPGLAFGTGTHPTTRQCLEWLGSADVSGLQVIDYGCGSGVLAVAAAMLGADAVVAVDIDPQAVVATNYNATNNDVLRKIKIGVPAITQGIQADILLANILFQPLMDLAEVFAAITKPGGKMVISGVLQEQVDALLLRYNPWFTFDSHSQQSSWALLQVTRHS